MFSVENIGRRWWLQQCRRVSASHELFSYDDFTASIALLISIEGSSRPFGGPVHRFLLHRRS